MTNFFIGLIIGVLIGAIIGIVLMIVATSSKIDEINREWYDICLRITDDVNEAKNVIGNARKERNR